MASVKKDALRPAVSDVCVGELGWMWGGDAQGDPPSQRRKGGEMRGRNCERRRLKGRGLILEYK